MKYIVLKSKIHGCVVTENKLEYEGSITLDRDLMDAARLVAYEKVHVLNVTNGARFETYVIEGRRGSREVCINGAAARLAYPGDKLIVLSYTMVDEKELAGYSPVIVRTDEQNRLLK